MITGQSGHANGARIPAKSLGTVWTGGVLYRFANGSIPAGVPDR